MTCYDDHTYCSVCQRYHPGCWCRSPANQVADQDPDEVCGCGAVLLNATSHPLRVYPAGTADRIRDGEVEPRQRTVSWSEVDAVVFPRYFRRGRPCLPADRVPDERWAHHQHTLDVEQALDWYEILHDRQRRGELVRDLALIEAPPARSSHTCDGPYAVRP